VTWLLVVLGGAAGAVVRDWSGRRHGVVIGTDLVNRVGSVLLGVVVAAHAAGVVGGGAVALLGVGVAGGMTTFSTWMVQIVDGGDARVWPRLVRETLLGLVLAGGAIGVTGIVLA
jgi:fluoride ion exporter CrcB/FEX